MHVRRRHMNLSKLPTLLSVALRADALVAYRSRGSFLPIVFDPNATITVNSLVLIARIMLRTRSCLRLLLDHATSNIERSRRHPQ